MLKKLNVGIVVFEIGVVRGFEQVRSAHIQIPMELANSLNRSGVGVSVITNPLRDDCTIPVELNGIEVNYIYDPRVRNESQVMYSGFSTKINLFNALRGLWQIRNLVKRKSLNVVHFFNGNLGVGIYAGLLKFICPTITIVWTPSAIISNKSKYFRPVLSTLNKVCFSTDFLKNSYDFLSLNNSVIKHGALRCLKISDRKKFRVTFWRDPSWENGADVAYSAFELLSNKFPNVIFTILVRPHWESVISCKDNTKIEVYTFPYREGVTLEGILSETLLCVFPFRELSVNPQLAILESLEAGLPVLASDVESVREYVLDKEMLVEGFDPVNWAEKIEIFLKTDDSRKPIPPSLNNFCWDGFSDKYIKIYKEE